MLLYFGINFILLMFTYILVYMLEKTFGYVSSITLVELSNINTPILKMMSETSPGTFQHSLQVSILASEAAAIRGANGQLVRSKAGRDKTRTLAVLAVEFDHVSLTYKGAAGESLSDITFSAKAGQTIGIIGGTGSG